MSGKTNGTRGSTNLFLLAAAIFLICALVSASGGKSAIFLVGLLITIVVTLTGAVVRAIEQRRQ